MTESERTMIRAIITSLSRGIILWLVDQKPMSGYGIVKELERSTGQHFTSGVIYPLLYELEKEGCISGQWTQKGRRHTKYYSITPTGVELLKQLRELFEMPMREALIEFIAKEDTTN